MYTIEVRAGDGDTVRAQLDKAPDGLLCGVTPQEVRDALRDILKAHQMTTDTETIRRFFEDPRTSTSSTPSIPRKKVA